jgi:hypothetical protein
MVIVLVIQSACPNPYTLHELLPDTDVGVVHKGGQVVDVVAWLIEVLDGNGVGVAEANQVLEDERVVFPKTAPEHSRERV